MNDNLFRQVTIITEEYLGPSAERFVSRQITFHLGKEPEALTEADLPTLIEWSRVTFGLLTEDRQVVDDYARKLNDLAVTYEEN